MILEGIEFFNKQWFWLLLVIPIIIGWYILKNSQQTAELKMPNLKGFEVTTTWLPTFRHVLFVLRIIALGLLITALARLLTYQQRQKRHEVLILLSLLMFLLVCLQKI